MNGKHAAESYMSLQFTVFEMHILMQSSKIVDFAKVWLLTSHNWFKYCPRIKNALPIARTREEQSAVFFSLSSTMLSFFFPRNCRGHIKPSHPALLPYENCRAWARVNLSSMLGDFHPVIPLLLFSFLQGIKILENLWAAYLQKRETTALQPNEGI